MVIFRNRLNPEFCSNRQGAHTAGTGSQSRSAINNSSYSKILAISCISPSPVKDIFTKLITDDLPISIGFSPLLCDVMYKPTDTILSQN